MNFLTPGTIDQAPVVQTLDSSIHRINHYPLDNSIGFASVYPLDSDLSGGQRYPSFEQLGPEMKTATTRSRVRGNRQHFGVEISLSLGQFSSNLSKKQSFGATNEEFRF